MNKLLDIDYLGLMPNAISCEQMPDGTLVYRDDTSSIIEGPSADIIAAETARGEAYIASMEYSRKRARAYPTSKEQADMQYWDAINGTTVWLDTITAIKAEFPKTGVIL